MDDAIEELTHSLLLHLQVQGGDHVRKRAAYRPPPQKDLQHVFDCNMVVLNWDPIDMSKRLGLAVHTGRNEQYNQQK